MAIIILQLDKAQEVYTGLCATHYTDNDVDHVLSPVIAKQFDKFIDELLDDWVHVGEDNLYQHLQECITNVENTQDYVIVHELLYDIHYIYGHLGLIVRVALLDHRGNILIQTEEIDDVSHRFYCNPENRIV